MSNLKVSRRSLTKLAWVLAVLLPVLAMLAGGMWLGRPSQAAAPATTPEDLSRLESFQTGFIAVASAIAPSVVFIEVQEKASPSQAESGDSDGSDPWRQFFGPDSPFQMPQPQQPQRPQRPQRPVTGQGSGVVLDPSGYILTNNHVVRDATKVTVHLANGDSFPAEVCGTDPMTDLAVIKISPRTPLHAARLGDAGQAKVGAWAIAVGYPFGASSVVGIFDQPLRYEPTITVGVVSALHRQTTSERNGYPFRDLIQTNAQINPGNSGGPLVNIRGEVIGINQQIYTNSPMGGNIGVGFAIPIDGHTKSVIETLKLGEKVTRGRLGMTVEALTPTLQKVWGVKEGVYVQGLAQDGPAARAGIKPDDIVVSFQGKPTPSEDEFVDMVQSTKPGTRVQIEVLRDGKRQTLTATVEAIPSAAPEKRAEAPAVEKLGIAVAELPADMARKANLPGGVVVRSVDPASDAAQAGLRADDIITRINRDLVTDLESYRKAAGALKKGDAVAIGIWRGGETETLEIESLSE